MNRSVELTKTFIWDYHTRIFHWLLAVLFVALLVTGLADNLDWMVWHQRFGYGVLSLIIFRTLIGVWGLDYARFSRFPLNPKYIRLYLSGKLTSLGHNPLGAWMIVAMLISLTIQVFSGLLSSDEFFVEGPWVFWADEAWVSKATQLHNLNWILISTLVAIHLGAISIYHFIKKENLVSAMITGYKQLPAEIAQHSSAQVSSVTRTMVILAVTAIIAWSLVNLPNLW